MGGVAIKVPEEFLDRYATAAPRYTSYPTAVDWQPHLSAEAYPALLNEAASKQDPCAIYVHIPFCERLCLYCGCNVFITRDKRFSEAYLERLLREFKTVGQTGFGRRPVTQYHWGGGTPTSLDLEQIQRLQEGFSLVFTLAPDAEVAIEVDPRVTSPEQLFLLGRLGFNRLSLGIQDFDLRVQQAVHRVQSVAATKRVVEAGRAAGFRSVSVDLIYGLPYQTLKGFQETVETVLEHIRPERLALFHLAHVPWLKKHHKAVDLRLAPGPLEKLRIFTWTVERLTGAGYVYLGLDHFALPDDELARAQKERTLQRNFMGYSTRAGHDLLGFGVSSIGSVSDCYIQSERDLKAWNACLDRTGLGFLRGYRMSADDRLRRDVIMRLMCHGLLVKSEIEEIHNISFDTAFERELKELEPLAADGLLVLRSESLALTPLGQVFMRNIAIVFDRYFQARRNRGGDTQQTFSRTL